MPLLRIMLLVALLTIAGCTKHLDYTDLHPTRCDLHNIPTRVGVVPIAYGLPQIDYDYLEAKRAGFQNADRVVSGGCIIGPETKAKIRYCPNCRAQEALWLRKRDELRSRSNFGS